MQSLSSNNVSPLRDLQGFQFNRNIWFRLGSVACFPPHFYVLSRGGQIVTRETPSSAISFRVIIVLRSQVYIVLSIGLTEEDILFANRDFVGT